MQTLKHTCETILQALTCVLWLQWLQLDWLCAALEPQGLPPLLLNKFLSLAKQRI